MPLPLVRLAFAAALTAVLPFGAAFAQGQPAGCAALVALVRDFSGYEVAASLMREDPAGCVVDAAELVATREDWPDLKATTLRLAGEVEGGVVMAIDVDLVGLRLVSGLGGKQVDERLQAMFRLQNADLRFGVRMKTGAGRLEIRDMVLSLSGGTEISLDADMAATGMSVLEVAGGRLTWLHLVWKTDGRLLRGVMELAGAEKGRSGPEAIGVARERVAEVVAALPVAMLVDESRAALDRFVASLPEGHGVLDLTLAADPGIGAADLLLAGLQEGALAQRLAGLFAGSDVTADWRP